MQDRHGRAIGYLRLSLTPACQMRCVYCRPQIVEGHVEGRPLLDAAEIEAMVRHMVRRHGLRKVRLTGGDPTARPDLIEIIGRLAGIAGLEDLAMTTNGLTLARDARRFVAAGLRRINVSLDTLDPGKFARVTGVDGLERVLAGIDAALEAGLGPVKLNTVVLRDENEPDMTSLVDYAANRGVAIRFIELMPMGPLADRWAERYVPASRMRVTLESIVRHWRELPQGVDSAMCHEATLHDGRRVTIGFITPMSCNFCGACNRIRIAGDGTFYPCLMDEPRGSVLAAVRPHLNADAFDDVLAAGLDDKASEHPSRGFVVMTHIGG